MELDDKRKANGGKKYQDVGQDRAEKRLALSIKASDLAREVTRSVSEHAC